jgi:hypothetical protein
MVPEIIEGRTGHGKVNQAPKKPELKATSLTRNLNDAAMA